MKGGRFNGRWGIAIFTLFLLACFLVGVAGAKVPPPDRKGDRILFGRVIVEQSRSGFSLVVKLGSTIKNDGYSKEEILKHLQITPPLALQVTPRPDGFLLSGPFSPGEKYTLTLRKGMKSLRGAILTRQVSSSIKIPQPSPHLSFLLKGRYVGRNGDLKLPVRISHGEKILLTLCHVPDRNLALWEKAYKWEKRDLEEITLKDEPVSLTPVGEGIFLLDLASYLPPDRAGLYRVLLKACRGEKKRRRCSADEMFLVVTNMGLVVKTTKKRVYAWVVDLENGRPVPGVVVRGYSIRNIKLGEGVTRDDGACSFPYNLSATGRPFVVTATKGKDYTYLPVETARLQTTLFKVGGINRADMAFLAAFVLERNLYRPGETLHYAVALRDPKTYRGVSVPVVVRFRDPKDRVLMKQRALSDSFGLADFALPIPGEALTGTYRLELVMGGKVVKTQPVHVEDFVPERLKVRVASSEERITDMKKVSFKVVARYLFGAPVAGEPYRAYLHLERVRKGFYQDYLFGPARVPGEAVKSLPSWRKTGKLNGKGEADFLPDGMVSVGKEGPLTLKVSVEVKEAGSERISRGKISVPLRLSPVYPGLKLASMTPCQKAVVEGILVNADGHPVREDLELRYQLYEVETHYVLTYSSKGRRRWNRTVTRVPISGERTLKTREGKFRVPVELKKCWMDYLVAVSDPSGGGKTELLIPGWQAGKTRPPTPEILRITLDKKEVAPGEPVKASAVLPFPGRVLWTLELDDVIRYQWGEVKDRTAVYSFKAPDGASTCYISAYLYQTKPGYLVTRAFGVNRLRVVPSQVRARVQIKAPEEIRPGESFDLKIQGPPGGKALVAVVDEGILQITRAAAPDLYNLLLRPYRLSVDTSEGLGWILPRFQFLPGGGEEAAKMMMAPVKPIPRFFRTFSYWKVVPLSAQGTASVPVTVKRYQGALKVMVSVLGEEEFGSAAATTKVASQVVVQPTLPRLLRRNDTVYFPVSLVNTVSEELTATVRVKVEDETMEKRVTLPPKGSQTLTFSLHPALFYGLLPVEIEADFPKGRWRDTYRLLVLPDLPRDLANHMVTVEAGSPLTLDSYFKEWASQGLDVKVLVSSTPLFGGLTHVERLLQYPYGCVEQTASTLLTLVRLLPFMKYVSAGEGDLSKLKERIRSGILRLVKIQDYSGGFPFWPGGGKPHEWGSVYATFALLEAKEAGFYVPSVVLDRALQFLWDGEATPWTTFVLAKSGKYRVQPSRPPKGKRLGKEALLLAAGTLYYTGYPEKAKRALEQAGRARVARKRKTETFFSPLRLKALELYMTYLITPDSKKNAFFARDLMARLRRYPSWRYTTQELAWSLVAIGRYLQSLNVGPVRAVLQSGGTSLPVTSATAGVLSWDVRGKDIQSLSLKVSSPKKAWATLTIHGYRTEGFKPVSNKGIVISTRLLKKDGKAPDEVKAGDLLVFDVILKNTRKEALQRLAVRVPMVAGLEVVNERLFGKAFAAKRKGVFNPRYVDVRDDEVRFFGDLPRGENHYFLLVRATFRYAGTMPPPRAEVMYRPWIYGIGKPVELRVK
ncbi:MAG: hypothetical protein JRJ48_02025 [Deltaproteobacteria bacterium]|nr:hypothetical protein [Deltaproteobacteria bacterium]